MTIHAHKTAVLSSDGQYRYLLERLWGADGRVPLWIMLNPSTADASVDDPTIRRVMAFSKRWGYDGAAVVNLFAVRATDPALLPAMKARGRDIVGPDNDAAIQTALAKKPPVVIAAWGARAEQVSAGRGKKVLGFAMAEGLIVQSLGVTRKGDPLHPLYLRSDTFRRLYP